MSSAGGQGGAAGSGAGGMGVGGTGVGGTGAGGSGVGGSGVGGTGVGGVGGSGAGGAGGTSSFPPVTDFAAPGPFPTTSAPEGPACTMFRPTNLGEGGLLHPVIVWGNGTTNTPSSYTALFNHFASHGFIVAAANTSNSGSGAEMIGCLDYMLAQNGAAGSPYQGRIDANRLASSGYSQGGGGALMAGRDPRFTVTAPVAPYIVLPLGGFSRSSVGQQTHPMFLLSGSSDTVAAPSSNQAPIFSEAQVPIVWGTLAGATHFEVLGDGKGFRGPLTAWFRFKLMGDASAGAMFEKNPCNLCTANGWSVQHNGLWQ
jgi:hypothetical protein